MDARAYCSLLETAAKSCRSNLASSSSKGYGSERFQILLFRLFPPSFRPMEGGDVLPHSDVNFPIQMRSVPTCTITSVNGTSGVLSEWAMSYDTNIKVYVNEGGLCKTGFSGINAFGLKVFNLEEKYSFKVIADANL